MPSTNATKIEDPEKQALASTSSTLPAPSSQLNKDTSSQKLQGHPESKMSKIQHIFLCGVLLLIFTFTVSSAAANGAIKAVTLEERLRFQELLDSVEPGALHDVLHEHMKDKYRHGVYQEDKTVMEVVHQTRPEVAQSLVELAKRQSNNSTASIPTTSSTVVVVISDTSTTAQVPVTPTTTPADPTPTPTPTPSQTQQPTSQVQEPTTTAVQPTQVTSVTTSPGTTAVVVPPTTTPTTRASTTPATTPTTSQKSSTNGSPSLSNSPAPQSTTTNRSGTTTSPTNSRSVTQQIVYTTTLANGAPTTVTSITVVPADQAENTGSSTKTNPNASLQTNGSNGKNHIGLTGILGAIGVVVVGAL